MIVGSKYYLLDRDRIWLRYISPIFNWITPKKMKKLSVENIYELNFDTSQDNMVYIPIIVSGGLAFLSGVGRIEFNVPIYFRILVLLFIVGSGILYRVRTSIQNKKRVHQFVDLETNICIKLAVFPKFTDMFKALMLHVLLLFLNTVGFHAFLFAEESFWLFVLPAFFLLYLFADPSYFSGKEHHVIFKGVSK